MHRKDSHKPLSSSHQEDVSQQRNGNSAGQNHVFVPADNVLLTVDEVAEILRVPRSWVYSHQDQLPTVRLGRYVRFRRSEIDLFLDQQKAC